MTNDEIANHIASLQQEIAAFHKKDQALQRQIQALISANLTTIASLFLDATEPDTAKKIRGNITQSLEALKSSILKSQRG